MNKHEVKNCPLCKETFECKVGSIILCQCTTVVLNEKERIYMNGLFDDCLCSKCMKDIKAQYHNEKLKNKY